MSCQATEKKLTQTQSSTIATRLKEKQVGFRGGSFNKMNTIELVPPQKKGKHDNGSKKLGLAFFSRLLRCGICPSGASVKGSIAGFAVPSAFFLCPFSTGPMLGTILQCEGPKRDVNVG